MRMSRLQVNDHLNWQLIRFLLVGVANTLFGLSVIYLCMWLVGMEAVAANLTGYVCGFILSFTLHRNWSFRHRGRTLPALLRFLLVILIAYQINLLTVLTAIDVLAINSYIAQAMGILPYTLFTYLGSRFFAFSSRNAQQH